MYAEEVRGLKEKIKELQRHGKHEEKSFKKQQEYLVILEGIYREVCEKAGVSSSLNFTTAQEINDRNQRFKFLKVQTNDDVDSKALRRVGAHSVKNFKQSVDRQGKGFEADKMEVKLTNFI